MTIQSKLDTLPRLQSSSMWKCISSFVRFRLTTNSILTSAIFGTFAKIEIHVWETKKIKQKHYKSSFAVTNQIKRTFMLYPKNEWKFKMKWIQIDITSDNLTNNLCKL